MRGLASWASAYRFPTGVYWPFFIWKGLQFWRNLQFCVFVCFLESNPGFVLSLLRAFLVDLAIAWCRVLPLHAGPFWRELPGEPIFSKFQRCYRQLSITNQCLFLSSSSLHPLKVLSHAHSRLSLFLFSQCIGDKTSLTLFGLQVCVLDSFDSLSVICRILSQTQKSTHQPQLLLFAALFLGSAASSAW